MTSPTEIETKWQGAYQLADSGRWGQIVGTYRALGTGTRIPGSGNRRDPRPTESE
jgi:hypothetical protein